MTRETAGAGYAASALRFGLAGTGFWASNAHAPALASCEGIEFAAVWGRNAGATAELAGRYGVRPHADFGAFLRDVDAVAFAIAPDVQAELAVTAAAAGKHLLLEKPLATSDQAARALADAVGAAAVASVVFFTARFQPDVRAWLTGIRPGHWSGGNAVWLGTSLSPDSPFNTPWRRDRGALWDLGPHLVSLMWASLGPVRAVTADAGRDDVTHLIVHHAGGASSVITVSQAATPESAGCDVYLWGAAGRSAAPKPADDPVRPLRVALTELAANARAGETSHECDVRFALAVGHVLAQAEAQITARAARRA